MSINPPDLEAQLEALLAEDGDKLAELAAQYVAFKKIASAAKAAQSAAGHKLLDAMAEQGVDSVGAGPVKVGITVRRPLGIAEGDDPDKYLRNIESVRTWVEKWNPTTTPTTTAAIKQARDAELAEDGSAVLPEFLVENEVPQLSVRKK
jgi:hypothetical protein